MKKIKPINFNSNPRKFQLDSLKINSFPKNKFNSVQQNKSNQAQENRNPQRYQALGGDALPSYDARAPPMVAPPPPISKGGIQRTLLGLAVRMPVAATVRRCGGSVTTRTARGHRKVMGCNDFSEREEGGVEEEQTNMQMEEKRNKRPYHTGWFRGIAKSYRSKLYISVVPPCVMA